MTELECKEVFEKLSEYLDRELPPDLCEKMRGHIEDCPPCVEFVNSLRKTVDLCRQVHPVEAAAIPEEIKARIRASWKRDSGH